MYSFLRHNSQVSCRSPHFTSRCQRRYVPGTILSTFTMLSPTPPLISAACWTGRGATTDIHSCLPSLLDCVLRHQHAARRAVAPPHSRAYMLSVPRSVWGLCSAPYPLLPLCLPPPPTSTRFVPPTSKPLSIARSSSVPARSVFALV